MTLSKLGLTTGNVPEIISYSYVLYQEIGNIHTMKSNCKLSYTLAIVEFLNLGNSSVHTQQLASYLSYED